MIPALLTHDVKSAQPGDGPLDRTRRLLLAGHVGLHYECGPTVCRIAEARLSGRSWRRATRATAAPSAASRRAVAAPIPLLDPLTRATVLWS
jgi:hypothetical protein